MNYYSYKYHEIMQLDAPTYDYLVRIMLLAKTTDKIALKEIISYPHLKKEDMSNLNRKLFMESTTDDMRAEKSVTANQLGAVGIEVGSIEDYIKGN